VSRDFLGLEREIDGARRVAGREGKLRVVDQRRGELATRSPRVLVLDLQGAQ